MPNQNLPTSLAVMAERANIGRVEVPQIAIDPFGARAEDTLSAEENPDGSFDFSVSVVDVGALDGKAATIRAVVAALRCNDYTQPQLPPYSGSFSYGRGIVMPSLTISGAYQPGAGFTNFDIARTKVDPQRYTPRSKALRENPSFIAAARLAASVRRHELKQRRKIPAFEMPPQRVINIFSSISTVAVATLARDAGLPQLLHSTPTTVQLADGNTYTTDFVSPDAPEHISLARDGYRSLVGNPIRDTRCWFNVVSVSNFLRTGESVLSYEEANLIAGWFNRRRTNKMQHYQDVGKIGEFRRMLTSRTAA